MSRPALLLETIEERILCSAVPTATEAEPPKLPSADVVALSASADPAVPTGPVVQLPFGSFTQTQPQAANGSALTDAQRAAIENVVRDSTEKIFFEKNVGQFPEGVSYGFRTNFGSMLVYGDHLRLISNQADPATGTVGQHVVDIAFTGSGNDWQIVPGGSSGATGSYQQGDGSALRPDLFTELTLRDVYQGVDLRLYSADMGVLEFDWILARAQDYAQIRIAATGQDGIVFHADGSATLDLRFQDLALKMPEVYQVIDGVKVPVGAAMVAGEKTGEIRYSLSGNIVADQPLVIDPNIAWSTYFDLNDGAAPFDSYVFAVNVNSTGVYVSGWVGEIVTNAAFGPGSAGNYMEVNAGFAQGTVANQGYIYRLNTAGTNITAWTSTGVVSVTGTAANQTIAGNGVPSDLELFPDGRVLTAWTSGLIQIYSADLATRQYTGEPVTLDSLNSVAIVDNNVFYVGGRVSAAIPVAQIPLANIGPDNVFAGTLEGAIIRFANATTTPTPDWATYVGGDNAEYFTAIALTPDKTKLVFSTNTLLGANYPTLVNAVDSTPGAAGTTELLIGVLPNQAAVPVAFSVFSFLGGTGNEGLVASNTTASQITASNTYFYVGGNTVSTNLPGIIDTGTIGVKDQPGDSAQVVNGGGLFDVFASRVALTGSLGTGFQSTYLGGSLEDNLGGIAYDSRADKILVYGTTAGGTFPVLNSTPASGYYDGTFGGGTDIFISTFSADLAVKQYASYIGGTSNDYLGQTGDLIGQGHMGYSDITGLAYLATTVHSALPAVVGSADNALAGPGKDKSKSNGANDSHYIVSFNTATFDFGDAPASYEGGDAAREGNFTTIRLGLSNDSEGAPFSGATATGDDATDTGAADDEDAIALLPVLMVGNTSYSVSVSVFNNTGATRTVQGWIDLNLNGTFEANELATASVVTSALQQTATLTWSALPALPTGQSYLRLRFSDAVLVDNVGTATIDERSIGVGNLGEIEDYALTIQPIPALVVNNVTATEGTDGFAVFTVGLSNPSSAVTTFTIALANVTAVGGAVDYGTGGAGNLQVSTDGGTTWADAASVTIPSGGTTVLVRTPIVNDALNENAETFTLTATRTAGITTNASVVGTGTIVDNDPLPSFSVNDVTVNEAAGTMTFTVTLDAPSGRGVNVNYATSNGTAVAGADYTGGGGTLSFAPGVTTQTFTVTILNDAIFETSEAFNVTLSAPVNALIADGLGIGTILDAGNGAGGTDNDTPTLSVNNVTATEGLDGFVVFTVSLGNLSTTPVSFNLALANGSATGADFGPGLEISTDGGATWTAGTSGTIAPLTAGVLVRTPVVNDALDEAAETFTLTATRTAGATLNASATGTGTIVDNDPPPALSINDVTVNEAAGTMTFTVTLDAPSGQAVSVGYATSDGSATAADYTAASGTLNFAAGVTSRTFTVPILNDAIFENSESFNVTLSAPVNATIADGAGVGTIRDDGTGAGGTDNDTPLLNVSSPTVMEGTDAFAIFTVSLSNLSTTAVSFNLALANGSATGADYGPGLEVSTNGGTTWTVATSATIAAGTTSVLVRTPVVNDLLNEAAETFTLTATRTAGTTVNASATGTGTILDNDGAPSLSINDVTVNEAAGTMTFTVSLSAASGLPISVAYATSSGTATAGADFTTGSGTLNFAAGVTSQTFTVAILNDALFENSETLNVTLSAPSNATIADGAGVGTILDNGGGAGGTDNDTPTLSVGNVAVTEGTDPFAVFAVSLSNLSTTPVSFNLALADGSAVGADYGPGLEVSTNGGTTWTVATSATIAAGTSSVLVRTPVVNDVLDEAAETFTLTATRSSGTTVNAVATGTATIADNDPPPSLTINDVTVNEAAGTMTFTVTLSTVSGQAVSVNYATSDGTATAADYTAAGGTLNFAAGVVSQTITVAVLNDALFENSESFNVNLSAPVNATIADGLGIGTILDNGTGAGGTDNDTPTLGVSSPTVTEGTDPFAVFAVSLNNLSTTPVSFNLALANGSATGADYGPGLEVSTDGGTTWTVGSTATIAAGTTSVLVRTPISEDALDENAETFTLTATRTAGTTVNASAVGTGTILDNDAPPSIAINDVTVNEAAGTMTFTVTLNAASGLPVSVNYATSNGPATAGADYTAGSGTLNFAAGVVSQTITVAILNDAIFENSESFNVNLSAPTNATIADGLGIGTILDAGNGAGGTDNDTPTLNVNNVTVTEGTDAYAIFTVALSNLSTTPVSFNLALANGSATAADFGPGLEVSTDGGTTWTVAGTATIAAGSASVQVRTPIVNDLLDENAETFTLTATRTAGTTVNASAAGTGTILDNDPTPSLTINDVTVNEAAGTMTFTVTLSAASGLPVSVNYATSDGTATAADYTGASGTLNFAAGVVSQTITVAILNDALFENSESFDVNLSAPTNATIADGLGIGTILDNGGGAGGTDNDTPTFSVSSPTGTEGTDAYAIFTVSLSNLSTTPVSVSLALANGLASGADYGPGLEVSTDGGATWTVASTATIAAGSASVLVRTPIVNDALAEPTETFTLTASRTAGTTVNANATGTGTIVDNDGPPSLTINDVTVNEAAGTMTFTVSLSAPSGLAVSVNYATSDGTATAADYTAGSGTLNFAAGVVSQTITVAILNDALFENSESFNVTLSAPVNAVIADGAGIGTILDNGTGAGGTDNDTPTVSVSSPTVTEGTDAFAIFTVSLSNLSTTPVSFNLALANGSASGADFGPGLEVSTDGGTTWSAAASATIAAGSTSVLVRTPITDDALDEPAETFTLTATRTAGTTTNASVTGTATILDDDATPSFTIDDIVVNEGAGTATFTVTLSAASGQTVSFNYATASGTAGSGADFTSRSGTLSFAPGTTTRLLTVPILNDAIYEGSEQFLVVLSAAVNGTIADGTGVATILDNGTGSGGSDNDTPTLAVNAVNVVEGTDNFAVFTVSLSNPSTVPTSFNLALANGTATGGGTDYGSAGAGNLQVSTDGGATWTDATAATIAAGATEVLVRTPIVNDASFEASETFTLSATVTAGTTTNAAATGTGTIGDNDGLPSLSIDDVTVNEGAGTMTFTVRLNVASGLPVTVGYASSDASALAGADYTATSGLLTFAPGVTSQTFTVPILNDAIFEGAEIFNMTLSAPTDAIIADGTGVGKICDNGTGGGGTDDDTPTLSVSNVTVTEGTDAFAIGTVSLSNPSTTPVTTDVVFLGNTATGLGVDFGGIGTRQVSTDGGVTWTPASSVTFAPGKTSVLVRTPIIDDARDENSEDFTLTATVTSGTTRNASAVGTMVILDNDPAPTLTINDVTVNEAAGTMTFTVALSAASGLPVSVGYATSNGTATAGADYASASGTLNFAAGVVSQTITVAILNDAVFESGESFNVNLSAPVNATIADGLGIGTIRDDGTGAGGADNDTPTLSVTNVTATEGTDPFAVFAVSLSNLSTTPVSFNLALANGSAVGADYGPGLEVSTDGGTTWTVAGTATIAAGSTSVLVRTPISEDALDENAETFTLTATRTAGATVNASAVGTGTILDNDAPPSISINDVTVNEAAGTMTFTVTLSGASGLPVSVNYATSDGAATAADYTGGSGTLNFAAGVVSQTITVAILNDAIFEQSESFNVTLSAPTNATIADGSGIGTILDAGNGAGGTDNDTPALSVSSPTVTEGTDAFAIFTVALSNLSTTPVSFNLALANGSATGADFGPGLEVSTDGGTTWTAAASGTIAPLTASVLVRTPMANDALNEATENFTLTATRTAGITTNANAAGTGTILDNDAPPTLAINDVTRNEGAGTITFTVTLSAVSGQAVAVNYATGSGTATSGADFAAGAGTLNFAPGVTSQTITLAIVDDAIFEQSENFNVTLSAAVNATIADGTGIGTILDDGTGAGGADNDTPGLSVSSPTVTEGTDAYALFTVALSNASTTPVSVSLALANGSARDGGRDFGTTGPGNLQVSTDGGATWTDGTTVTIAAGTTSVLVRTPVTNDALDEDTENFTLTAAVSSGIANNTPATGTGTIVDDEPVPTLSIVVDDLMLNEAAGTMTFTVRLSQPSGRVVTVDFATADGTARAGFDYMSGGGTLTFLEGVTSQTVTVAITNDAIFENSENFNVVLGNPVNATIADATGVGTILDNGGGAGGTDNDTPTLSVNNVTVTEGTDGFAVFSISLSNLSTTPVSISLALANGSATGADYGPGLEISTDGGATWTAGTSATIAPLTTSVLVRTPVVNDALDENAETFTLIATVSAGTTVNPGATGTGTILDNDPPPSLSIDDVTRNEGAGTITFTVTLNAASGLPVSVNYAAGSLSATAGADFAAMAGTLNFAAGVTTQTITVLIVNDAIFEVSENFSMTLSAPSNGTIADGLGIGTILDNGTGAGGTDNDTPALSVGNVTVTEGTDPFAIFAVSLSNPSTTAVSFNLALANGSATGADYGPGLEISTDGGATWTPGTSATIAPLTTGVLVRTPVVNDVLDEAAETFTLTATRTAGPTTNASATGTATIIDDDATPSLAINDVTRNEAAGTMTFTVTLSAPSGQPVAVDYATASGTATGGADFTADSGTLSFAPGVTSQTITVAIGNDAIFENSETFSVVLGAPSNATIADGLGIGTILDNGTGAGGTDNDTPTLSVGNVTVTEGTDAFSVFAVSLSNLSTTPVSFNLALADGSATGADYGPGLEISTDGGATWTAGTSATIAPLTTGVLVRTPVVNDVLDEAAETFTLTATRTAGATTNASATGTGTINDDDAPPAISINDVTVNEGAGTITFTVSLSAVSGQPVSVNYTTGDGTALAGVDYSAGTGALNFAPGVVSRTVTLAILNDAIFEQSESFNVVLNGPVNATIADGLGIGKILDDGTGAGGTDNDTPILTVSNVTVLETSGAYAVFAVGLSNPETVPVSFNLALADGSASGADYGPGMEISTDGGLTWTPGASATIAPLSASVLVRTPILDDLLDEAAETFTLTATVTAGTTTSASATGTGTIVDDDATPTLSINDVTRNEAAGTITFTVTLSAVSALPITVDYATSAGTATGADYAGGVNALSGTLAFAPGVASQTITLAIVDDAIFEQSESFVVTLTATTNAIIADGIGLGTIVDDGTGAGGTNDDTPGLSVGNVTATEGSDPFAIFAVSLSNPSTTAVSFNLALANGSATGADYGAGLEVSTDGGATWNPATGATIAAGTTSVLVRTPVANDALDEAAETFTLSATRTGGVTVNASAAGTATIIDDDVTPSLSINDVTVNEAAGTMTFTVTLDAMSGLPVSVDFALTDGTATAGADYTTTGGTLNFAAGVVSQTVTVAIANDAIFENSESFDVTLSAPVNATIADGLGSGTILDNGLGSGGTDNDMPTLSVSSVNTTEGTDAYAVFTVSLSNASTTPVSFNLALANGSATGADYGPGLEVSTDGGATWTVASSATIAPLTTSVLVRTPIVNDLLDENVETFTLTATRTSGTTTNASAVGTGTINDNDPTPSLAINDVTVNEAAGTMTFTVTLSAASGLPVSVDYALADGTALAGADYTTGSGTLNFAAGVVSQTITVPILDDAIFENSESFSVTLSTAVNATIADGLGIGTIRDDGTGAGGANNDTPSLSVSSPAVVEGTDNFAIFTVSLSNLSTTAVSFNLALANGSATGADYGPGLEVSTDGGATWTAASSAMIAPLTTSVLVRTAITDDLLDENAETFTLTATRTAGTTTNASAAGTSTITDDDATPSLSINDVTRNEAAGTMTFTVTLSAASGLPVSVNFATSNGTATAGADYTAASGTLNFAAGVVSQTVTVAIANDTIFEQSENFTVTLSAATNASIADATGVGTIRDDGTGAGGTDNDTPTLSVSSPSVIEGTDAYAIFTVSLSNASAVPVSFNLALADGSATGVDYGAGLEVSTDGGATWTAAGSATIAPLTTSVLVRTPITNDLLDENAETFTLTATRTAGTTTNASAAGTATITDDDAPPAISIDDVTVNEAAGTMTFTVTLSGASALPVSVNFATSNGTATAGADYTSGSGALNFAAGVVSQTITVPILDDAIFENSETLNVTLSAPVNATVADGLGIGTIRDDGTGLGGTDDDTPTLSVSDVTVTEGANPFALFTVSLSNASTAPVSFNLALANGLATGADYGAGLQVSTNGGATWTTASSATIAAGTTSVLVRTPITNDALDEGAEDFTLTASVTTGTTVNASAVGTATILDAGSLRGTVFSDANNSGTLDGGETLLPGVTVRLTGTDDLGGAVNRTTVTDAFGEYVFRGLRPGTYQLVETQPAGWLDGANTVGSEGGATVNNPAGDTISGIVLGANVAGNGYDFAELAPASLSGSVFQDVDNDGAQGGGEAGIPNVTVTLTGTDDLGAVVNLTTTTASDGTFAFTNLRPGNYTVTETQPVAYDDGIDTAGSAGGDAVSVNDEVSGIILAPGQNGAGYTFADRGSAITGTVFVDANGDGVFDPGELGLGNVTLELRGSGGTPITTTTTAADGSFVFRDLPAGDYSIVQTQPSGYGSSTPNTMPVLLTTSGVAVAAFGETTGSLSGVVYHDLNNDGLVGAGEPLLAGALITLTGVDVKGGAVSLTTTTLADGSYTFTGLLAGTYSLAETQPAGYRDGRETAGSASGNATVNDTVSGIRLGGGSNETGYLFGERTPSDLIVTKNDGLSQVRPGEVLSYTITIRNPALQNADGVIVTDQFPTGVLDFISASNGGTFNAATGTIRWSLGALAGSGAETITLTIVARVKAQIPAGAEAFTNIVTAVDPSSPGPDPTRGNNTARDTDTVTAAPDLYVLKTDNLTTTTVGDTVTYTISGGNAGDQAAGGVIVRDALPKGVKFVSASHGGKLVNGEVVWHLGTLRPGETYQLTVKVIVELVPVSGQILNPVTIEDEFGPSEDPRLANNRAFDLTSVKPIFVPPGDAFVFAFDTFHNFSGRSREAFYEPAAAPEIYRLPILPLAPIYSGEADPGATLFISLVNARGITIGEQTVMADAGGNWLATFPSATIRDVPSSVRITEIPAPYSIADGAGYNLRTYFSPALNPGHFFTGAQMNALLGARPAPLLGGLGLENPLQLGAVKYGGELLGSPATASGY